MASRDDEERREKIPGRLIQQARQRAHEARYVLRGELIQGSVSQDAKQLVAKAAMGYYDELKEHREESVVENLWEETGIDELEEYLYSQATVRQEAPGATSNTQVRTVPAIQALTAQELIHVVDELDNLAKELGFSAAVTESHHRTVIDDDLIREVEKWRKQNLD